MRKQTKRFGIVFSVAVIICGLINLNGLVSATVPGTNQRVSLTSAGAQSSTGGSGGIISANGKVVVFSGGNILPSGGGGIFARNLETGSVVRINMSTAGVVADSLSSQVKEVSANGRYVLFTSLATNLIDGTSISSPSIYQLYLRDTKASTTTLISQNTSGTLSDHTAINTLGISSDGRFIAFRANATNLNADSTDGSIHIYMLDRLDNTISIIDRKTDGSVPSNSLILEGGMSCDGSMITFQSGNNLIVGDSYSNHVDVYLLDRRGNDAKLTNLTKYATHAALTPTMSCNGDFIGFKSMASNLDPSVSVTALWNVYRPFIYDRVDNSFHLAAVTSTGLSTTNALCPTDVQVTCIEVSDTGLGVFFARDASLPGSTSNNEAYIRNIYSNTTELLSKDSGGIVANTAGGGSGRIPPTISADGSIAAYTSEASNLVPGDTNGYNDVFTSLTGY